jgi:hypothetical protein
MRFRLTPTDDAFLAPLRVEQPVIHTGPGSTL